MIKLNTGYLLVSRDLLVEAEPLLAAVPVHRLQTAEDKRKPLLLLQYHGNVECASESRTPRLD